MDLTGAGDTARARAACCRARVPLLPLPAPIVRMRPLARSVCPSTLAARRPIRVRLLPAALSPTSLPPPQLCWTAVRMNKGGHRPAMQHSGFPSRFIVIPPISFSVSCCQTRGPPQQPQPGKVIPLPPWPARRNAGELQLSGVIVDRGEGSPPPAQLQKLSCCRHL